MSREHTPASAAPEASQAGRESGAEDASRTPVQLHAAGPGAQTDMAALMAAGGNQQMVQLAGGGDGGGGGGTPVDAFWDTRLKGMGLEDGVIRTLKGGFSQSDLEAFITGATQAKFIELVTTRGLGPAQLTAHGADFFKTFVGCGQTTIDHVAKKDGVGGGEVKGTHDDTDFREVLAEKKTYKVPQFDSASQPIYEPLSAEDIAAYEKAKQKYEGQKAYFESDRNDDGKGGKRMKNPPREPAAPQQEQKTIETEFEQGQIHSTTALSVAGVQKHDYGLRREDTGAMRGPGVSLKTTIDGLKDSAATWQAVCNEAIWNAIKAGTFGRNWSGMTSSGAQIDGFYNGGDEVDTFFFVT